MNNNESSITTSLNDIIKAEDLTSDILQRYIVTNNINKGGTLKVMPITTSLETITAQAHRKPRDPIEIEIQGFGYQKRVFDKEGNIKLYNMMQIVEIIQQPPTIRIRNHHTGGFESLQVSPDTIQYLYDHNARQDPNIPSTVERFKNILSGWRPQLQKTINDLKTTLQKK